MVTVWWITLSAISVFNIFAWLAFAVNPIRRDAARRRAHRAADPVHEVRARQLLYSALFVFGCAFRSIVPRADVQRICIIDSWVSAVAVGRLVATFAELGFAAQCALFLRMVARDAGNRTVQTISYLIVPFIAMAETFSWYAVISTNYLGNTMEESTWTTVAALMVMSLALLLPEYTSRLRRFLNVALTITFAYLMFLCIVDVPMYFSRWRADQTAGRQYLSFGEGFHDATTRYYPTRNWEDWRWEVTWMSLYFSVGVWASIALVRAPYPERARLHGQAGGDS
jgi:hypothetical protein